MSSTSTPRRVSSFISRAMIVCSSACSSSSVGAPPLRRTSARHRHHLGTPRPAPGHVDGC
jgi:hypothetical protein